MSAPSVDGTTIKYHTQSGNLVPVANGYTGERRVYTGGNGNWLANTVGPAIVTQYSSCKFVPGTKIRWEPSVSFNTTGRVFVGFCDNPEVVSIIDGLYATAYSTGLAVDWAAYLTALKGLGSTISFPVWQETEVNFPTRLRRKMFDTNETFTYSQVDVLDRCMQTAMFVGVEGLNTATNPGGFWFHDVVQAEGIHSRIT